MFETNLWDLFGFKNWSGSMATTGHSSGYAPGITFYLSWATTHRALVVTGNEMENFNIVKK